jgi:hypothetical protein
LLDPTDRRAHLDPQLARKVAMTITTTRVIASVALEDDTMRARRALRDCDLTEGLRSIRSIGSRFWAGRPTGILASSAA